MPFPLWLQWQISERLGLHRALAAQLARRSAEPGECVSVTHALEIGFDPLSVLRFAVSESARHARDGGSAVTGLPVPNSIGVDWAGPGPRLLRVGYSSGSGFRAYTTTAW